SEILAHNHPYATNGPHFQSPEAEAIDKWFEDLSNYEQTLEEMAMVSLDHVFKEELSTIESWFRVLSEAERTAALYSLLQHSSQVQIRFFITVLQQMAKKDPVGALLSPTHSDKLSLDPVQSQLHSAMAKAELEAGQRLMNVLPIQPPQPIDRPTGTPRRPFDRHSVAIGESEEYSRLFRSNMKRNSIDFLGRTANNPNPAVMNNSNSNINNTNTNKFVGHGINSSHGSLNGSTGGLSNTSPGGSSVNGGNGLNSGGISGHTNGMIGSGVLSDTIAARVNQYKSPQTSLHRISAPNMFGSRPKSIHEGDASASMFLPSWNFATLGGNPLTSSGSTSGSSSNNTSLSSNSSSILTGSPGHIGDRSSFGRPKSVSGTEWMLGSGQNLRPNTTSTPQAGSGNVVSEAMEKSWMPMMMSPNMGGFHNGTTLNGHANVSNNSLNTGGMGYVGSGLAVERPKSVTEADLVKMNFTQWMHMNGNANNNSSGNNNGNNSNLNSNSGVNLGNGARSHMSLEELKANNRRRTLLRPSAIISNVPVTVMEGDEKLLSASANTSSINIVSTMYNENPNLHSASIASTLAGPGGSMTSFTSTPNEGSDNVPSMFQYPGSSLPTMAPATSTATTFNQAAVQHQLQNLALDSSPVNNQGQYQYPNRSRAPSPIGSPMLSPMRSGFRSRPNSRPASPSPSLPSPSPPSAGFQQLENDAIASQKGVDQVQNSLESNSNSGDTSSGNTVPTEDNQKKHLSPLGPQRPIRTTNSNITNTNNNNSNNSNKDGSINQSSHQPSSSHEDEYLSDTSDISNIGPNGPHGRAASTSTKEKKQSEGVDFELLQ
ncbi:hypothetical protein BGW38_005900, partial [Lunasporangiospora selenospora]